MFVYVGSYGSGITVARQDPATGTLETIQTAEAPAASYLAWHPDGRHLYAVQETQDGAVTGFVAGEDGRLTLVNREPTGGAQPCDLAVHPAGRHLLVANYGSGSVAVHRLGPDGHLGPLTDLVQHRGSGPRADRQAGPHAHQVRVTPDGEHVFAVDLGVDSVFLYRLDLDTGKLALDGAGQTEPGAGPRHLVFAGSGVVHVACELNSTVASFSYAGGELARLGTIPATVEPPGTANLPSEIALSPDGRFVYLANRGQDVVTVFAVDGVELRPLADVACGGHWPRHLAIVGQYLYVANQRSHQVTCFRLDVDTGTPRPAGVALEVESPACVLGGMA
ncbi:MAG: lactonase family protein [Micromonosporaceae bacterium]|jgi:6-phosphogluconolactonase (cycloisomerase 2 family)|nr:lactonase family protein [Micromonosporaceae bacterium]